MYIYIYTNNSWMNSFYFEFWHSGTYRWHSMNFWRSFAPILSIGLSKIRYIMGFLYLVSGHKKCVFFAQLWLRNSHWQSFRVLAQSSAPNSFFFFIPPCRVPTYRRRQKEVHMTVGVPQGQGTVGIQSALGSLAGTQPNRKSWFEVHLDIKREIIASWWTTWPCLESSAYKSPF